MKFGTSGHSNRNSLFARPQKVPSDSRISQIGVIVQLFAFSSLEHCRPSFQALLVNGTCKRAFDELNEWASCLRNVYSRHFFEKTQFPEKLPAFDDGNETPKAESTIWTGKCCKLALFDDIMISERCKMSRKFI